MPSKNPEKRRATVRAWYARTAHRRGSENREKRRLWKLARRNEIAAWWVEHKSALSCIRCGESHPACIQFHHTDPTKKEISLALAVTRAWGKQRILAEAAKCVVLCANCHIKHHAAEASK